MTTQDEDQFLSALGNWGKWQLRAITISGLFCIPIAWHVLTMTFMNAKVKSWCARPPGLDDLDVDTWLSISGQVNQTCQVAVRPWDQYAPGQDFEHEELVMKDCDVWEYDRSEFSSTLTGEFDLVCGGAHLLTMVQSLYFVGMILGVFTFGILADMFGRKTILVFLLLSMALSGILTSQMPSFPLFVFGRVLNAFFVIGIFEVHFTYCIELVGGKLNTIIGMGMEVFWVTGWLTMAIFGYLFRSWRELMLYFSLPSLLSFLLIWTIPESPRWLIATGRLDKAEAVIRSAAEMNGRTLPASWTLAPRHKDQTKAKINFLQLFKTCNMRSKTLIIYYNFFVNALVYYGLTLNIGDLAGDVFVNFTISGVLEIPAYGGALLVMLRFGRRVPYAISLILSGVFLISICLVPKGVYYEDWPATVLALLGKACVTFSFGALFVYSAELFPTEIRTTSIGSASFIGRLGGILAPWVAKLAIFHIHLPLGFFGLNALLAGFVSFFLPETRSIDLPYTIEEAESLPLTDLIPKSWRRRKGKDPKEETDDGTDG